MNFQKLIDTISDAFSIFDFSYIISGGLTFLIILYDLHCHQINFMLENVTVTIICGIFLSYICGVLSWLCGKNIRRFFCDINKEFEDTYNDTKNSINDNFRTELTPIAQHSMEYEYMWICLCKEEKAKPRINFIHRFWVMQAIYEGLIFTLLVFVSVLLDLKLADNGFLNCFKLIGIFLLSIFIIFLCVKEAANCARNQIKEVILSYYLYCFKNQ